SMKILSILGARPQFIKASAISREITKRKNIQEKILHTGQHFDANMSKIFFDQMQIPKPDWNLEISNLNHGAMTGRMIEEIENILLEERPDWVLLYGDTNSTISGALSAKKLHLKIAHVEAGLRSYNMKMPEEINRILTDRISDILFCPTKGAADNLKLEGFKNFDCQIVNCGDVMYDNALYFRKYSKTPNFSKPQKFILTTIHRAENTDDSQKLASIFRAFDKIAREIPIVLPLHPRTKQKLNELKINISNSNFIIVNPVGYLEMVNLLEHCSLVMTDSGGLQKEAFFFKKHCVTLREETEWTELVDNGFNIIAGNIETNIYDAYKKMINKNSNF
ncbi:MAG: UDP-N-acetylglucosamine 2-epimerase (non-hydrolyzing), partial [Candidatus Cloacimonadota bacterium]|nr:UDP-N-acetylglucosamine 2-epimerase (non-hydrolyzing) [Candidatus Cloacimonadota bacterium]